MRFRAVAAAAVLLAGCSTPFDSMGPETGPPEDPESLGAGIHGWPWLQHAWHGPAERTDVLWPLVSVRESLSGDPPKTDSFLPLFVHSSSPAGTRWGLRPLFDVESRVTDEGPVSDTDLLFPVFKSRTAPGDVRLEIRPIWWQGRRGERSWLDVFPVYWSESGAESSSTLVLPSYYRREEEGEVRDLHLWPFWGMHAEGTLRRDWTLFPFFSIARDPEKELLEWDAPFPLIHYGRSKDSSSVRVIPLYVREASPGKSLTVVVPFWAHGEEGMDEEWTSWLGPMWIGIRDGKRTSTDVLWPLFRTESDPKGWSAHLFPVLWLDRRGEEDAYTHVWPLFGTSVNGKWREVSTAFPFFTYGWDGGSWSLDAPFPIVHAASRPKGWDARVWPLFDIEEREKRSEGSVLLLLARWDSSEKASDFRVLWKLFERERTAERTKTALNPLFRIETNARGDTHWSVLFGLLAATTEEDATRWRILWFL